MLGQFRQRSRGTNRGTEGVTEGCARSGSEGAMAGAFGSVKGHPSDVAVLILGAKQIRPEESWITTSFFWKIRAAKPTTIEPIRILQNLQNETAVQTPLVWYAVEFHRLQTGLPVLSGPLRGCFYGLGPLTAHELHLPRCRDDRYRGEQPHLRVGASTPDGRFRGNVGAGMHTKT